MTASPCTTGQNFYSPAMEACAYEFGVQLDYYIFCVSNAQIRQLNVHWLGRHQARCARQLRCGLGSYYGAWKYPGASCAALRPEQSAIVNHPAPPLVLIYYRCGSQLMFEESCHCITAGYAV
jgi:hypothetical protein